MAVTYTQLRFYSTDKLWHRATEYGGSIELFEGGEMTPRASLMFPTWRDAGFAPAIDACDRLIEELQALRAEMLQQAVATDPAYAAPGTMPCVESGEHSDTIEHEQEYRTHTGRHAVK